MLVSPCHKRPLLKRYYAISGDYYLCNLCDRSYKLNELVNVNEIK